MDIIARIIGLVYAYAKGKVDVTDHITFTDHDVYIVWFNYTLGGYKALVSTTLPDGMYYEVTYNKNKGETYLDAYKKFDNICFPDAPIGNGGRLTLPDAPKI
jgi:hypothetical protein